MPDYGHALRFGTFVTPVNRPARTPVELAQASESAGYELVTFQDHPYQPSFHDTWTLLTWVASRTDRIHVSGNVLNLPLRQPAVLARSAASLDLLSGGRVELGLGAGGFWDAIEAMGGTRLTPGQGVDALSQALDIIRGIWDAGDRRPLRAGGEHHHVDGAKRGPLPAHDIPIWLGAAKPRMQRLIGRKADGWLPSLPWLKPGDLAAGNAIIDEAAEGVGRRPDEVHRLLNIGGAPTGSASTPAEWAEQLLPMALDDGVSTFILAADDRTLLERFAAEVAPALREAVAAERGQRGVAPAGSRRASAIALRRAGIDYDAVPASLAATAVEPGDHGYGAAKSTYLRGGTPGLVLRPADAGQVAEALAFARAQDGVALGIRSAGHGISGRSTNDGGIVIDVGALDGIEVLDESARRVRIGPGAHWGEVAAALAPFGWALSSGDYGGVGVGGLATAGGIGWLAREHGLTIDHLVAAEIVLADGTLVRADAEHHPELFWAIRGAGANFGIVTSFEFVVDEVSDIGYATLVLDAGAADGGIAGFLEGWGAAMEASPRDVTSFLMLGAPRSGRPAVAHVMVAVASDDAELVTERLQPFAGLSTLLDATASIMPYAAVMANAGDEPHAGQGEPVTRSALAVHLGAPLAEAAARLLEGGDAYLLSIRALGGAVADVPVDATAFAGRDANFSVSAFGADRARLDAAWEHLAAHTAGTYLSFETDTRPERIAEAFPPATLSRLRTLKAELDPDNVFRDNFNVVDRERPAAYPLGG